MPARKNYPPNASIKSKHKITAQRVHHNKPGKITLEYEEKVEATKDIDFMARGYRRSTVGRKPPPFKIKRKVNKKVIKDGNETIKFEFDFNDYANTLPIKNNEWK